MSTLVVRDRVTDWLEPGDLVTAIPDTHVQPKCLSVQAGGDWPALCTRPPGHRANHAVFDFNGRVQVTWGHPTELGTRDWVRGQFLRTFPWLRLLPAQERAA